MLYRSYTCIHIVTDTVPATDTTVSAKLHLYSVNGFNC